MLSQVPVTRAEEYAATGSTTSHNHPQRHENRTAHAPKRWQHIGQLTDMSINPRADVLRLAAFLLAEEPPERPKLDVGWDYRMNVC